MHAVDFSLHYPTAPERVPGMLADADFQRALAAAASARSFDITTDGPMDGDFTLTVVRVVAADKIPAAARALVGDELTIRQTEQFHTAGASARTADISITVDKAPASVRGSETLRESEPGVTEHAVHLEVSSSLPLFGARIEQSAAPVIARALKLQESTARDWLSRRGCPPPR